MTSLPAFIYGEFMLPFQDKLAVIDERALRIGSATLVTLAAIGAFITRTEDVVSWVFLGPTVALFWIWALANGPSQPVHLLGLAVPPVLNLIESDEEISIFISIVTVAALAGLEKNRNYVRTVIPLFIFVVVTLGVTEAIDSFGWPNWLFGFMFAWGVGELLWRLRGAIDELEQTRALVTDQAMLNERRRIARDVHDLVGHSLTVVMLHVSGARHLVHKDPAEAERALVQAEEAGRQSLAEIRRTVGLLRDENEAKLEVLPTADLFDIPTLVEEFTAAGVDVEVDVRGRLDLVDPAVGLASYRITQEALTNVSRHAVGGSAQVTVVVDDERCEVSITSSGGAPSGMTSGAGMGLTSMRERARSVGGSLIAGPDGNGWKVEATLPVNAPRSLN